MAITSAMTAANAYGSMQRLANRSFAGQDGLGGGDAGSGGSFADLIKDQVSSVVDQGRASEQKQRDMLAGKADIVDVVTAVSETQLAMETMVSVRDRVIAAYEEIMRMPI